MKLSFILFLSLTNYVLAGNHHHHHAIGRKDHNLRGRGKKHSDTQKRKNPQRDGALVHHFTIGDDSKGTRIVGGQQSDPGEFPYYVDMGGM